MVRAAVERAEVSVPIIERAKTVLAEAYAGPNAAIDPAFLAMLLDIVFTLLEKCRGTPSEAIAERASRNMVLSRLAIRRAMRTAGEPFDAKVAEAVLRAGQMAAASEIEELRNTEI